MRVDLAGYVINAVLVEGRSVKEVCEAHEFSRSWLYELIARYRELGEEGLKPQSKRPTRHRCGWQRASRTRSWRCASS
jgi:transposase